MTSPRPLRTFSILLPDGSIRETMSADIHIYAACLNFAGTWRTLLIPSDYDPKEFRIKVATFHNVRPEQVFILPVRRGAAVLTGVWGDPKTCENCSTMERTIFKDDGECDCGCRKHHYHCPDCGRIQQVG